MPKRLPLILFLSFIAFGSYSQKSTLTLSLGPSFPVGDFAAKNIDNKQAGFASVGEQVNISFDYKVGKHISLSAMLYGQRNGLNRKAMESNLSQRKFYGGGAFVWSGEVLGQPPPPTTF